jgi:hypothetical protein
MAVAAVIAGKSAGESAGEIAAETAGPDGSDCCVMSGRLAKSDSLKRIVPPLPGKGMPHLGQIPVSAA